VRPKSKAEPACPECGLTASPDAAFCSGCGSQLSSVARTSPPREAVKATAAKPPQHVTAVTTSGRSFDPWILGMVAVGVLVVSAFLVWHFALSGNGASANSNVATVGVPCSQNPQCSVASGSASTAPTAEQLQSAYQQGYFYGQHLNGPESFCETRRYSNPQLNAQYQDGCVAGLSGGSSSNNYGGIAGNQAPSPTTPDVQPYSGG